MKKIKKILVIILIIIVLFLLLVFIKNKYKEYRYIKLNDITNEVIEDNITPIGVVENTNKEQLDNYRIEYNNNEIVGKLSILNSDFKVLFAQTTNNDYYLNHLLNKEYNNLGSTFLDYRVNIDNSKKLNIYGHNNTGIDVSFNYLMNYLDESFYKEHRQILINTDNNNYLFEIFSIQIVDSNYIHMKVEFNNIEEWNSYLNYILNNSIYKEDIEVNDIDRVLTLQTCTNIKDGEYLLVNARIINNNLY